MRSWVLQAAELYRITVRNNNLDSIFFLDELFVVPLCRFPHCNRSVFYDSSISEMREWCSYGHMRDAIANKVEKPCKQCQVWPRQKRSKYCSGNLCRYVGDQTPPHVH
ncbi:hypothetical protein BC826DRAFT_1035247 [Russula brevipes]|nr:hypothetical protein BC826DRAFT_1035247 [Russula brevipes]